MESKELDKARTSSLQATAKCIPKPQATAKPLNHLRVSICKQLEPNHLNISIHDLYWFVGSRLSWSYFPWQDVAYPHTYRRWTKYSNLEERIGRHPLPQMSKLKNVCALCHAAGFDLFCPPVSTLGRRKQL